jgi:N,N'-diacetyllegionaminate synthase
MSKKTFIIAEAGVNHNGSLKLAKKLIDVAAECKVDAVKFQTFKAENLLVRNTPKAIYQKENTDASESQFEMIKKLELNLKMHKDLIAYSKDKGILFLSTPFDNDSINMLSNLGLEIFKIPSGEITNLPYLRLIGSLNKKIILSTGMSSIDEVRSALNILIRSGSTKKNITILHANTMYPTPMQDVNLNAMLTMQQEFDVSVGYSDHTLGIEVDIAAVAMGASCIEKHFTLDKKMDGPDHKASLEPNELKAMVLAIRNIEKALGSHEKKASPSEIVNFEVVRKSIVAKKQIKKGDLLTLDNITVKRPGVGISPMRWDEIIGKIATKNYNENEIL